MSAVATPPTHRERGYGEHHASTNTVYYVEAEQAMGEV